MGELTDPLLLVPFHISPSFSSIIITIIMIVIIIIMIVWKNTCYAFIQL